MPKQTRVALIGASGRLGSAIVEILNRDFKKTHAISAVIGRNSGKTFAGLSSKNTDVILDVSSPQATQSYLQTLAASKRAIPYVVGCTGFTPAQFKLVQDYAKNTCVIYAPNFSLSVNLFLNLIEYAAPLIKKWNYDVVLHETHHTKKKDSPSGTAKAMIERLGGVKPQVQASRAGNIIGTHELRFVGPHEILSLTHEALDRSIFAQGAITAAGWAASHRESGLFSMKDVLFG